jgi:hydrogenase expression/formation protein HypE
MGDLIKHLFAQDFKNDLLDQMSDSTILPVEIPAGRIAFSTDSYVIHPIFFPGGDIGELAINGTVNDLAMSGARPLYLSCGFILEEGLEMKTLGLVVKSMAQACKNANVVLTAGDTKVVNKGHGDGLYINTAGIGVIDNQSDIRPQNAKPGDAILVSGTMGDHGIAVMSIREGLRFESNIESDTCPLFDLVESMLGITEEIHCLRDITRGGLAAVLNELAEASKVGFEFEETKVPVHYEVQAACEMLGLDPLFIANEGKLVAIVPETWSDQILTEMRKYPAGIDAVRIGKVVADHPGVVLAKTSIGGSRVVDIPAGELLPRIC